MAQKKTQTKIAEEVIHSDRTTLSSERTPANPPMKVLRDNTFHLPQEWCGKSGWD
jgi:hypothetical protein